VQYAETGDAVTILVGHSATKTWWRNFVDDHDIDILIRRSWTPMTGRAIIGADEPDTIAPLLEAYLTRFPSAARVLDDETTESKAASAVLVWCRPR
jgi:hypothetical protein